MIQIRDATREDAGGVFDLIRELMQSPGPQIPIDQPRALSAFNRIIEEKTGSILVAEEDGLLLGLLTLSYPMAVRCGGVYACIEEFVVGSRARGKGVGGKLLEAAKRKASEMGCHEIQVNRPSEVGYPVYIRHGWKDLGKHLNLCPVE